METATIAISGSGGLVGSALRRSLPADRVVRLVREAGAATDRTVVWDPDGGRFDAQRLEGCEAVVHLAGEPIAAGRWSARVKERIRASRVDGTRLLIEGLGRLSRPPRVLVAASAIGYYGDRGDEELTEDSPPGEGYLPEVCRAWEAEAAGAKRFGARVVHLRIGIVLAREGGALKKMLTPFRLGLGGRLGHGRQWMSWIHIDDLVSIIHHALAGEQVRDAVNAVSPGAVRNADFTRALARALRRPAIVPAPAPALRLLMGEMAEALLLGSQRVVPRRLLDDGFRFRFAGIDEALEDLVGR